MIGLEPTTFSLGSWRSTTELHPQGKKSWWVYDTTFLKTFNIQEFKLKSPNNWMMQFFKTIACKLRLDKTNQFKQVRKII